MIRIYITAIATALLVGMAAYGLHCLSVANMVNKHKKEIMALVSAKDNACALAKSITNEVSDAYQKDLTSLDIAAVGVSDLLDSVRGNGFSASQPACSASGCDAAATEEKLSSGNSGSLAPDPRRLIDIGRRAEKNRLQLLACQNFVRQSAKPTK